MRASRRYHGRRSRTARRIVTGYFNGSYYLYGAAYRCGYRFVLPWATSMTGTEGFCGIATYKSDDLVNWRQADLYTTPELRDICAKGCFTPRVIWSPKLER